MSADHNISPFKFLDSYTANDREIFFGRDSEIENIYQKVFQSKLLLVYGASGTGKSSLINCGLANMFLESDWLPVHVRRLGNIRKTLFEQINKQAIHPVGISEAEKMTNAGLEKVISSLFLDHFKPIYLIFDQFEELFIFGNKEEWKSFIEAVKFLIERDLEIHFIFVMRGEYLEFLSEFEEVIPEFFDNRIRVEKMTRKSAESIVLKTTKKLNIEIEEGFEEQLIKKLNPEKSDVELTFLQVFLDRVYKESDNNEGVVFKNETLEKLGQVGDILAEFVDEQLFRMSDPKAALAILKSFVSLQGTKAQKSLESANHYIRDLGYDQSLDATQAIISQFVNRRILKERDENGFYELRHDSLAQKIFEKITNTERELLEVKQFLQHSYSEYQKREILLSDEDISYIQPFIKRLSLGQEVFDFIELSIRKSGKKKRQRRAIRLISIVIVLLTLLSLYGFFSAQRQKAKAEQMANLAQEETKRTAEQKALADRQKLEAERQAQIAMKQSKIAEQQKMLAESAQRDALKQKELALVSRDEAARQKNLAEAERENAIKSAQIAQEQAAIAEVEKKKADQLRMLSLSKEIAIKSQYIPEPETKGLVAVQAYQFNLSNDGKPHSDFHHALYSASKTLGITDDQTRKIHEQPISSMINIDNTIWTTSSDGKINRSFWKNDGIESETIFQSSEPFQQIFKALSNDQLIVSDLNGEVFRFDINEKRLSKLFTINNDEIVSATDQKDKLLMITRHGKIIIYQNGKAEIIFQNEQPLTATAITSNTIYLSTAQEIIAYDLDKKSPSSFLNLTSNEVVNMRVSKNESLLATGSTDGEITIWNLSEGTIKTKLSGHTAAITDLAFLEGNDKLISTSFDRSVRVWPLADLSSPPVKIQDRNSWISEIAVDQESGIFYTGEYDGVIRGFYLNAKQLSEQICQRIDRELTLNEWQTYISQDIDYSLQSSCAQ